MSMNITWGLAVVLVLSIWLMSRIVKKPNYYKTTGLVYYKTVGLPLLPILTFRQDVFIDNNQSLLKIETSARNTCSSEKKTTEIPLHDITQIIITPVEFIRWSRIFPSIFIVYDLEIFYQGTSFRVYHYSKKVTDALVLRITENHTVEISETKSIYAMSISFIRFINQNDYQTKKNGLTTKRLSDIFVIIIFAFILFALFNFFVG